MMNKRGLLVVFSGPSGSGKGTVLNRVMQKNSDIEISVSVTTRQPRINEVDGVNYYFLSKNEFLTKCDEGGFLEWAEFCGNYYGTPKEKVEERLNAGKDVVLEIEVQGALKVREAFPDAVLIFTVPPSISELESRLVGRQTEKPEVVKKRIETATWEISMAEKYDYVIVNDNIDDAADAFLSILRSEKHKTKRNKALLAAF